VGLPVPRERNKTLTALAGAEPVTRTKLPAALRLQFFVPQSLWDPERVNARRLELLLAHPVTAPHEGGALVTDDRGAARTRRTPRTLGRWWPSRRAGRRPVPAVGGPPVSVCP
jgi:hypothetical protein